MANLSVVGKNEFNVADDLRELARKLDAGELRADVGVAILSHKASGLVSRHTLGPSVSYSDQMGLMCFGQHMLFKLANEA